MLGIQHFWPEKRIFPSFLSNHHHMNVDASLHRPRRPIACRHQMRPALGMEGPFRGGKPPQANRAFQSGSTRDGRIDLTVDSLRTGPSRSTQLIFRERSQRAGHRLRLVEDEPSRRSAENLMSHDEAGTLAVSFAKLPELLRR